jgi:hypothetical protein
MRAALLSWYPPRWLSARARDPTNGPAVPATPSAAHYRLSAATPACAT